MRKRSLTLLIAAISLINIFAFMPAASAAPSVRHAPGLHDGTWCYGVLSPRHWSGTICVIVNYSDATLDSHAQTLVTYKVRSGKIRLATASYMYLERCPQEGTCYKTDYRYGPYKYPNASSTFLSNSFIYVGLPPVQDVLMGWVYYPCIKWTNGQIACIPRLIHSGTATG